MTAQTILPANSTSSGGFDVANSVRLTGTNDYFHKTPSSSGSQRLFSFSAWVKKADFSTGVLFSSGEADGNPNLALYFDSSGRINMYSTQGMQYITTRVFRDPSAWYHIVFVVDTANGTEDNRQQLYVNGVRETVFSTSNVIDQNTDLSINTGDYRMAVGTGVDDDDYFGGYMAEVVFVDNQALASTSFGEFDSDSGIWKPKNVNPLTFGTNGFYLNFQDSSNLGNDVNGGTDLTEVNLAATDQSIDTCTNNFATMNPLDNFYSAATFTEGNLKISSARYAGVTSTFALTKGKWYFEFKCVSRASGSTSGFVGITSATATATNYEFGNQSGENVGYSLSLHSGAVYGNSSTPAGAGTFTQINDGDFGMVAADFDSNKIYFGRNGTWGNSQNPVNGTNAITIVAVTQGASGHWRFYVGGETNNATVFEMNFGSPTYAISSTQADDDDHGNFEYDVPTGYFALNTKNLAEYG